MQTISVIGGTGELGGGLAMRWAKAGLPVIIGSRDAARAQQAADSLNQASGNSLGFGLTAVFDHKNQEQTLSASISIKDNGSVGVSL